MLKLDGFDDCIVGVAYGCGRPDLLIYDTDLVLDALVEQGMSPEDAVDYFSYNM